MRSKCNTNEETKSPEEESHASTRETAEDREKRTEMLQGEKRRGRNTDSRTPGTNIEGTQEKQRRVNAAR